MDDKPTHVENRDMGSAAAIRVSSAWRTMGAGVTSTFFINYVNMSTGYVSGTVWPSLFFPSVNPYTGIFLAFTTFVIGFFASVIGAIIFGHVGDRLGRKTAGILSLIIGGAGSLGIGLTPGYSTLGVTSDVLLVIFRFLNGMGIGGLIGDAAWIFEGAAESRRRGLWGSSYGSTESVANAASALTFVYIITTYPKLAFTVGWRVLFYIGAAGLIASLIIRYMVTDTKIFYTLKAENKIERAPVAQVFRSHWKQIIKLMVLQAAIAGGIFQVSSFTPAFLRAEHLYSTQVVLETFAFVSLLGVPIKIGSGLLADKKGRLFATRLGQLLAAIWAIPYLYILTLKPPYPLLFVAMLMMYGFPGFQNGVIGSLYPEQFPSRFRYSGVSMGHNLGRFLGTTITTVIAPAILSAFHGALGAWPYIGALMVVISLVAFGLTFTMRETYQEKIVAN